MSQQLQAKGRKLLKTGRRGVHRVVFSHLGIVLLLLAIQVGFLFFLTSRFESALPPIVGSSTLCAIPMVLYLTNSRIDPTAKITWLIFIMLLPVFGTLLFLYIKSDLGHRALANRLNEILAQTRRKIPQPPQPIQELTQKNPGAARLAQYIQRGGCFPLYTRTACTYFPSGEAKFKRLLVELEKARHFIFLEYFILHEGYMWDSVLEILTRKAAQGVEVRVMFDGTCEFFTLPHDYPKRLHRRGIACKMFSPITPFISTRYNYRDHRKILVIDGHTGFTGGVNLADEYINRGSRYGHWKDAAIMLQGDAVRSFTLMFLQMWNINEKAPVWEPYLNAPMPRPHQSGFVLPYADSPLDTEKVGERVYMDLLNRATESVHIMSPYLILDGEMETSIRFAAERGVEVCLILPGIPDKIFPYALAKTHYAALLESGVKIYEYTPGFVHAKVLVCDNREAVVGTINLDYRSFYHHFECAVYLYETACIDKIEADFQATRAKCRQVTPHTIKHEKFYLKAMGVVSKAIAPLL